MSKTYRGGKAPGYEYWSRRPSKEKIPSPGKKAKRNTHRLERAAAKRELQKGE